MSSEPDLTRPFRTPLQSSSRSAGVSDMSPEPSWELLPTVLPAGVKGEVAWQPAAASRVLGPFEPAEPLGDPPASVPVFSVSGLRVVLGQGAAQKEILSDVSFELPRGAFTCLVGPSGCGKSLLVRALLGIIPALPGIVGGQVWFSPHGKAPTDLLEGLERVARQTASGWVVPESWRSVWLKRLRPGCGGALGYVAQHAWQALDPTRSAGFALMEAILTRRQRSRPDPAARAEVLDRLEQLGFSQPRAVLPLRPHELSGGMAQRLLIALVLARGARTILADEPTSGLDEANASALIDLLLRLRARGTLETLLLVTHDLGVAERLSDRLMVMDQGRLVESGEASALLRHGQARHARSIALITGYHQLQQREVVPRLNGGESPRLVVQGLSKSFVQRVGPWWRGPFAARERREVLREVSLELAPGEILGLMGPSGVGKSTLARCILGETPFEAGEIRLEGQRLDRLSPSQRRERWRLIQPLYQQVDSVLHPRMTVEEGLWETARVLLQQTPGEAERSVNAVLERVGLAHRRQALPGQLSGGELRRVGLARVLLVRPRLIVADEPTAGVDASLRAGVLELLSSLCRGEPHGEAHGEAHGEPPASLLIISHDKQALLHVADRIVTLREGRLVPLLDGAASGSERD